MLLSQLALIPALHLHDSSLLHILPLWFVSFPSHPGCPRLLSFHLQHCLLYVPTFQQSVISATHPLFLRCFLSYPGYPLLFSFRLQLWFLSEPRFLHQSFLLPIPHLHIVSSYTHNVQYPTRLIFIVSLYTVLSLSLYQFSWASHTHFAFPLGYCADADVSLKNILSYSFPLNNSTYKEIPAIFTLLNTITY